MTEPMKITDDMLTEWFPPHLNPVHVGFYQRDYSDCFITSIPDYWDGKYWLIGRKDGQAIERTSYRLPWRGLKTAPNGGQS